jgi:hypothetical protein
MMTKLGFLLILSFGVLSGCAQVMITLPYNPVTTEEIKGGLQVGNFGYFPKEGVQQNQIENTALGTMLLTENVPEFFANAVRRELRQAGVSLKGDSRCVLSGEINKFFLDDLGYSCTYVTNVRYILQDKEKKTLFDNSYKVEFNTTKRVVAQVFYANLNKVVADNINQVLKDKNFINAVEGPCQQQ